MEQLVENILHYYEGIISVMPGNVYWLDKNCIAVGCNQNVLDMLGLASVEQFRGMTFEDMARVGRWSATAKNAFKKDSEEVIRTGKPKLNIEEPVIYHLKTCRKKQGGAVFWWWKIKILRRAY